MYSETIELHGFTFKIEFEPDEEWQDFSYLGEYSNTPKTDAVDRKLRGDMERNEYRYFNPANTLDETRKDLHECGYSKHEAHELAKHDIISDYEMMEALNNGNRGAWGLVVDISYKGHELGHASVWDCDDFNHARKHYQTELMIECMKSAIKYLRDLDSGTFVMYKAEKALKELEAKLAEEGHENRRASFLWRIKRWRDLSHEYQNNRTLTRHAGRRIVKRDVAYIRKVRGLDK